MSWVPLDGNDKVDKDDKPDFLKQEDIDYILSFIPLAPAADIDSAELARRGIIEWMSETLKEIQIARNDIPEFINRILDQHYKSLIVPGTPIGITAAESVGATSTQMTLNSVAPWEEILIQDKDGHGYLVKIGEWIDDLLSKNSDKIQHIPENRTEYLELIEPVSIATCNSHCNASWEKVTAVTRHLPVGDLVKITTRSGRSVTVTQNKSLLIWNGLELVQTNGKDAKVGDKVPIFANIPTPPVVYNELDIRKYLSPKEWLYGSELHQLYRDYKSYDEQFWSNKDRLVNLPHSTADSALKDCMDFAEPNLIKDGYVYTKFPTNNVYTLIPEKITLDRQFGQIVGLYLAEGLCTDTFVGISNSALEIQDLLYKWCASIGVTSTDSNIHSVLIARLFKVWINTDSANKIMPPEILFGNEEFIKGVLDGYFAGNGCLDNEDGALSISSVSKALIYGTSFLCSRLGIFGKISGNQGAKNNKCSYVYSVRNWNADIWYKKIGSCHNNKANLMKMNYTRNAEWGRNYIKEADIMLDDIMKIETIPPTEYVYDLTETETTNFSLYNGINLSDTFHSSGSAKSASFGIDAMRDIIFARKSPKNESCTIRFEKKNLTFEEVLASREYIVGSLISDFIEDYNIYDTNDLQRYWWHETGLKKLPNSTKILRLRLNINEMFKHKVTIGDLAAVLEREIPPSVVTVFGPMKDAILDVFPDPGFIMDSIKTADKKCTLVPEDLAELCYLENVVRPGLSCIRVKGISGIKRLYPVIKPVLSMVMFERKVTDRDIRTEEHRELIQPYIKEAWLLVYNQNVMRTTGLTPENLTALCVAAGIEVIVGFTRESSTGEQIDDRLVVAMPDNSYRTGNGDVVVKKNNKFYRLRDKTELIDGNLYRIIPESLLKENDNGWTEEIDEKTKNKEKIKIVEILTSDQILHINDKYYKMMNQESLLELDGKIYEEIVNMNVEKKQMEPSAYINDKINVAKRDYDKNLKNEYDQREKEAEKFNKERRSMYLREPTNVIKPDILLSSEYIYAETDGSNLKELLSLHQIDKRRTTCNNMHTITETLGIEAATNFIIRSLNEIISNTGSYVHPANILFIAEFITSRGIPHGATFTGISRQPGGHISLATLERAGKVFTQSSLHGRKEDIRNVSASVAVGARMRIGDGSFDIAQDIKENGKTVIVINDDLFTALDRDDNVKELRQQNEQPIPETQDNVDDQMAFLESIGTPFDFNANEKSTNYFAAFAPGGNIMDINSSRSFDTPPGLIPLLDNIVTGKPGPETLDAVMLDGPRKSTDIKSFNVPLQSTGLVAINMQSQPSIGGKIPPQLVEIFRSYNREFPGTNLPSVGIRRVQNPFSRTDALEIQREQLKGLKPVTKSSNN